MVTTSLTSGDKSQAALRRKKSVICQRLVASKAGNAHKVLELLDSVGKVGGGDVWPDLT